MLDIFTRRFYKNATLYVCFASLGSSCNIFCVKRFKVLHINAAQSLVSYEITQKYEVENFRGCKYILIWIIEVIRLSISFP